MVKTDPLEGDREARGGEKLHHQQITSGVFYKARWVSGLGLQGQKWPKAGSGRLFCSYHMSPGTCTVDLPGNGMSLACSALPGRQAGR